MVIICKGCISLGHSGVYSNDVWLSEEGLCSKCYSINQHSEVLKWDNKSKEFVNKNEKKGLDAFL